MAPVRSTGPSSMGTSCAASSSITRSSGSAAIRHRSALPGVGTARLRLELVTGPVQIDLAVAEGKGGASRAERHRLHAQDAGVELHGGVDVGDGQHQMVKAIDVHELMVGGRRAAPYAYSSWRRIQVWNAVALVASLRHPVQDRVVAHQELDPAPRGRIGLVDRAASYA